MIAVFTGHTNPPSLSRRSNCSSNASMRFSRSRISISIGRCGFNWSSVTLLAFFSLDIVILPDDVGRWSQAMEGIDHRLQDHAQRLLFLFRGASDHHGADRVSGLPLK